MHDAREKANAAPEVRPDARVAARVEELLREQLEELGVNPSALSPQDIMEGMHCGLAPDQSMTYAWKGRPILHVRPEIKDGPDGRSVLWRMFTADDQDPGPEGERSDPSLPRAGTRTARRPPQPETADVSRRPNPRTSS